MITRAPIAVIALAALIFGGPPAVGANQGGEWITLAPMGRARQETGAARIGDRVYVVGGLVGGGATSSVEVYDVNADRWSEVAPIPVALDHMGAAAVGGKLYVMGGYSGDFAARDETWIYDPATDGWSAGAPLPEERGAPWAVAFRDRIYLFGGADRFDSTQSSTFIYDPAQDQWQEGAPMTRRREHLNAVALGDFIYVLGGRAGPSTSINERYDPATDRWQTMAPMPTARSAAAAAAFDGKIYVMGGEVPRLFAVNEVYDPVTDTWDCAAPMPVPRHGVAAVTLDTAILVPAGGEVQGLLPSRVVDSFVPDSGPSEPESTLRFSRATYRGSESQSSVRIRVLRGGATAGEVAVDYRSVDGSALAGVDYEAISGTVRFADGEGGSKSFQLPLLDDLEVEGAESLDILLDAVVGAQLVAPLQARVVIEDDDQGSPGVLEFEAESFVSSEGEANAFVTVRRTAGVQGTVTVSYASEVLSATPGEDYSPITGTLEWGPGQSEPMTFTVPLFDDGTPEGTELIRLALTGPEGGAALGATASTVVVVRDDDGPGGCEPDGETLCLLDGRFRLEVDWRDPRSGRSGPGRAIPESEQTGFFWFFNAANLELVLKVLDGRGITGAFWLFYGALSDVEYWILVSDTESGAFRVFRNPPFVLASFADTQAFPAFPQAPGPAVVGETIPVLIERLHPAPHIHPTAPCTADRMTLCLGADRFRVEVSWEDPQGNTGSGMAIPRTDQTGLFWFFNPENVELAVKILDGTGLNGNFWLFYGALSNVAYTITVTDTSTGIVKEYHNEQGNLGSLADLEAFDGPP